MEDWVWEALAESLRECPRLQEGFPCLLDKGYPQCPLEVICERKTARIAWILHKIEKNFSRSNLVTENMIQYLRSCLQFVQESKSGLHQFLRYTYSLIKAGLNKGDIEFLYTLGNPIFTLQSLIILYPIIRNMGEYISPEDNPW